MGELQEFSYVKHKHFPQIGKMLLVKKLQNGGWYGARYLADNNVLVYSEYHVNELEPYTELNNESPDFVMINL